MTNPTHFIDIDSLSPAEIETVLSLSSDLRRDTASNPLPRQSLGMIFEKPSTRTRVSFETAMTQLGGHAVFLGPDDTQLGRGEPLKDTARALSGYVDAIMARVFAHDAILELASYASVPVINGLTDDAHPCQTLADLLTIRDHVDDFEDVTVAWVGDGNNVAQSFALGCAMLGIEVRVATPAGFELGDDLLDRAASFATQPQTTNDPAEAVASADVIYTDVWVSMGEEEEQDEKLRAFDGFQLDINLLNQAAPDAVVLHCLPAHRGEEITDAVLEHERSLVWKQAENRLHAQKGLLTYLLDSKYASITSITDQ